MGFMTPMNLFYNWCVHDDIFYKLDVVSDGLLHNQLLNFCQNDVIDVY